MTSYNVDEPIYAPATAYAPSALAVIRLSGKNTIEMLSQAFSSPSRLNKAASKTLVHGYILDEENVRIDEVVLAVYREGSGYTGEEAVEISCHGSLVVLRRLSKGRRRGNSPSVPSCTDAWISHRPKLSRRSFTASPR